MAASRWLRLEILEDRNLPSTVTWINPAGGDWDTAANWVDDQGVHRLPGPADDAVIDTPGITVTHNMFFTSDSVHSLTSAANLAFAEGTITLAAASEVQSLTMTSLDARGGTLTGAGDLTIDGDFLWMQGTMSGAGHTIVNGTATIAGLPVFNATLDHRTLDNAGTVTIPEDTILAFANGGVLNNEAGATLVLRSGALLGPTFANGGGRLNNAGLVVRTGAASPEATINIGFDNTGTVTVQTGTLTVARGLTNEGKFDLAPDATATIAGGSSSGAFNLGMGSVVTVSDTFTQQSGGTVDLAADSSLNVVSVFGSPSYTMQAGTSVSGPGSFLIGSLFNGSTLTLTGDVTLGNVVIGNNGVFNVNSGNVQATSLTLNGVTTTVAATASLDVQNLTLNGGTLTGAGRVTAEGSFTWTGGTMDGAGPTVLNGTTTIGGGFPSPQTGREMDNAGTATVVDGTTLSFGSNVNSNVLWNNEAGATLTLQGSASLNNRSGVSHTGQLSNAGEVVRVGSTTSTSAINITFDNTGTVDVRTGTLSLQGPNSASASLTNEGEFDLEASTVARLGSRASSSGAFNLGTGSVVNVFGVFAGFTLQSGGTVTLAADSSWNIDGLSYTMQANTSVSGLGTFRVGVSNGGGLIITGDAALDNVVVVGGGVSVNSGQAQVTNLTLLGTSGATVAAAGSLDVQNLTLNGGSLNGAGTVTVEGTFAWMDTASMGGAGRTVLNGTTTIGGGFPHPQTSREVDNFGTATVLDGTTLNFGSNGVWNNEVGATLTLRGSAALGDIFFSPSGQLSNAGVVIRLGSAGSTSTINIPFDNTGTVDVRTGTLSIQRPNSASVSLTNEGEFDLEASAVARIDGRASSTGTFNLATDSLLNVVGTLDQQSGTVNTTPGSVLNLGASSSGGSGSYFLRDGTAVTGPGTVVVSQNFFTGILTVTGAARIDNLSVIHQGSVTVAATGSLAVGELLFTGGSIVVSGSLDTQDLTQTNGTVDGAGTVTVEGNYNWSFGTMKGTGHTVLNGTTTIGVGPSAGPILDTRTVDNAGTATLVDGKIVSFTNNALWNNEAGGTLILQGSAALGSFGPPGRFTNAGLLQTTGHGQASIGFAVTNSGTIDLGGILVINGNYTQTATGTLNIHLGGRVVGSQYDQLQVHGLATLDGTLNVTLVNDFSPSAGDNFRILTFNSRSGDFAAKNLPDLGPDLFFDPVYDGSGLTLETMAH
jgi:hypothetical protein